MTTLARVEPHGATTRLARALLARATNTVPKLRPEARARAFRAIDAFVAAPRPATYLAADRALVDALRDDRLERVAGATIVHDFEDGIAALRATPGLPDPLVDRLAADLPRDRRAGQRLLALASLARAYDELLGRVLADTEDMRRRLHRRSGRRRR